MFKLSSPIFVMFIVFSGAVFADSDLDKDIHSLQKAWAIAKYKTSEDNQNNAFETLSMQAAEVSKKYTGRAEPLIWQAIIISTHAGVDGGLGALSKVDEARELLEKAKDIDETALNGSVYTSLGSLYYQVPGWPLSFGDDDKAEQYLKKALQLNPNGIDPNFFYADFLIENGEDQQAILYLNKTISAKDRPSRPIADTGRRAEARDKLSKISSITASTSDIE